MNDLLRTLLYGSRVCDGCGGHNFRGQTYCMHCGQRIMNRYPLLRLVITVIALGIVIGVVWYKLKM